MVTLIVLDWIMIGVAIFLTASWVVAAIYLGELMRHDNEIVIVKFSEKPPYKRNEIVSFGRKQNYRVALRVGRRCFMIRENFQWNS